MVIESMVAMLGPAHLTWNVGNTAQSYIPTLADRKAMLLNTTVAVVLGAVAGDIA